MQSRALPVLRQDHMHREFRGFMSGAAISELCQVQACKKIFAGAHQDRAEYQVQLVDETGAKVLPDCGGTPADANVFFPGRTLRPLKSGLDSIGDEMKCGPAFHFDLVARMMCQYERRDMIRRFVAPPPFP